MDDCFEVRECGKKKCENLSTMSLIKPAHSLLTCQIYDMNKKFIVNPADDVSI